MELIDDPVTKQASLRFESLGQNCEMGFALRKIGNEDGQLLRWAVVPVEAITALIADPPAAIYARDALEPIDHDMVRDNGCGIAFHCEQRFARQDDGTWTSRAADPAEGDAAYARDAAKFAYMYDKFRARLAEPGTIFVYKDIPRPSDDTVAALSAAIRKASGGRAALAMIHEDPDLPEAMDIAYPAEDVAIVRMRQLVDNMYAETAGYEHWHAMFRALDRRFATGAEAMALPADA